MANREQVKRLTHSVRAWNQWRQEHPEIRPDLRGAQLGIANLRHANLSEADLSSATLSLTILSKANLSRTTLSRSVLGGANLSEANLSEAALSWADLSKSSLNGANLSGAILANANLDGTLLNGSNLTSAYFSHTTFAWVDLSNVKGLASAIHGGPSIVDINSVTLPTDEPTRLHFLRGVGFSDTLINSLPSLDTTAIQYHSCFISYSSKDDSFAKKLHTDLQKSGVRCWFAPHDMKIGDRIRPRIDEAIYTHEKLLLILSEHAIKSDWVEDEVEAAIEKERQQKCEVLFPIRLDDAVMKTTQAWAAKLRRSRHIGDFTDWQDEATYQEALSRLLCDLKVSRPPTV